MSESRTKKKTDNQDPNLTTLLGEVNKTHGDGALMCLGGDAQTKTISVIPTGSLALDQALGIGGYPKGRIIEVFGPESSGKTTLTLHAIAQVQRSGGIAAFIDAEHALDTRYATALGVDLDRLLIAQPDSGEQGLDIAETLAASGHVALIVVDSVAALVPRAEIEGDMGDTHMGLHARLMGRAVRKLAPLIDRHHTTLIFINQLRQKIGVVFGNPETTTGGQALRFYASVRLDVRRIGKVTVGETVVGNRTRVKVIKNKCAPPFNEAEFDIRWGKGIDPATDLIDMAIACGVLQKSGAHILFGGKSVGQGRERTREAVLSDDKLLGAVRSATVEALPTSNRAA
jgi:recombination protein RecA